MQIDWDALFNEPHEREPIRLQRRWLVVGALALFVFLGLSLVATITDWLWFGTEGQAAVFQTRLVVPIALFGGVFAVAFLWLAANWLWAARKVAAEASFPGQRAPLVGRLASRGIILSVATLLSVLFGLSAAGLWAPVLLYRHRQPFGVSDPIFHLDVGFYVFTLPIWQALLDLAMGLVVTAALGAAGLFLLGGLVNLRAGTLRLTGPVRAQLLALLALGALVWSADTWLKRYDLLFSTHSSTFFGPGYTDVTARLPVFGLMTGLGVVLALVLLASIRTHSWRLPVWALAIAVGVWLLAGVAYPILLQQWRVKPNELAYEQPYIAHNIKMTRDAYHLTDVKRDEYEPVDIMTPKTLADNKGTLNNVRLWDWRVYQQTVSQIQEIRSYYDFLDVDIDRYPTKTGERQVELSLRELTSASIQNPTWVNRHLEYTHGFGAVLSPIDQVESRGLPVLWVQDIPPVSSPAFGRDITQPRIYFGEAEDAGYVIVGADTDEFDYPQGDQNVRTRYSGRDGVPLSSYLRRILFALRFGDSEILLSGALTPASKLLMYRNVKERVRELAPFLTYDTDPYPVITRDGRLQWIVDAYATTDRYPYATPLAPSADSDGSLDPLIGQNYIRNSVKVMLDAYQGTATFYIVDPSDPIVGAWSKVFPTLFKPAAEMPEEIKAHWRYPETLFRAQAAVYTRYHITDPASFYNAEDLWAIPNETGVTGTNGPIQPYYVTMKLRGESAPEFVLMLPFSPARKDNMVAWMAARSDPAGYGQLVLYSFAKGSLVYGPQQIESLIQQDPQISSQVTLWGQAGSRVSYGNLLVIPLGDSILYTEPLYLSAEQGNAVPQLKQVIVAVRDHVAMRPTLAEALSALYEVPAVAAAAARAPANGSTAPAATPAAGTTDVPSLIRQAGLYEQAASAALRDGDWIGFGREMDALKTTLARLGGLTGVSPAASATPAVGGQAAPIATPTLEATP